MSRKPPLLILGASARAAAQSAARAGLRPSVVDLFADLDTHRAAPSVRRITPDEFPEGFLQAAASIEPCPWVYTGALENSPDLVERISRDRPLWGNPADVLREVRDPWAVASVLGKAGLPVPASRRNPEGLPRDGSWLIKPLASAGGRRIRPLEPGTAQPTWPCCYQERIEGPSLAAAFVATGGRATLLGVTRQRIGGSRGGFAYRGSLGPWPLESRGRSRLLAMGQTFTTAFGLVGLFGVDLIWRDEWPWPVEINPRYTASMEILEFATGVCSLAEHIRAFDPKIAEEVLSPVPTARNQEFVAKGYVIAPRTCRFPALAGSWSRVRDVVPRYADVPWPGTAFEPGEVVLTLFARGSTLEACERRLQRRLALWEQRLSRDSPRDV